MENTEGKSVEQIVKEALAQAGIGQAQPVKASAGYGDAQAQAQTQTMASELITVTLPFSCKMGGKWLNWTETYQIPDGDAAFNALLDRIAAKGKPLSLRGDATASGGGYGKK
jgi:hypothetical protein